MLFSYLPCWPSWPIRKPRSQAKSKERSKLKDCGPRPISLSILQTHRRRMSTFLKPSLLWISKTWNSFPVCCRFRSDPPFCFPTTIKWITMFFPCPGRKSLPWAVTSRGKAETVVFDKPGIVELRCDVHAEMAAYILVMKNLYFAVTDKKGNFEIPDSGYLQQVGLEGIADLPPREVYCQNPA